MSKLDIGETCEGSDLPDGESTPEADENDQVRIQHLNTIPDVTRMTSEVVDGNATNMGMYMSS